MHDPVNNPKHYEIAPGVQSLDIIRKSLTPEQFKGYCLGNILKYRLRAGHKDDLQQDIAKANTYAKFLEEAVDKQAAAEQVRDININLRDLSFSPRIGSLPVFTRDNCGPLSDCSKCPTPCK